MVELKVNMVKLRKKGLLLRLNETQERKGIKKVELGGTDPGGLPRSN